ncbi:7 transmembrane receptor [Cooperia oncophora]
MPDVSRSIIDTILRVNTCAYVATIVIGVVGNLWVAWKVGVVLLFGRTSSVPRQILYCIFVICCADLLVLCDLSLLVHFQISKQWIFGDTICKMFYCVEVLNKFLIPLALVHISRASYKSVSVRDNLKDRPRACMITANVLAAATVLMLMVFVGYFSNTNSYWVRDKPMTVCNFNPPPYYETAFNLIAFIVGYIMTSIGYVYFYANVPILLKRRYSTNVTAGQRINSQSILRIRRTVTAFVAVYLMCWTPYWILFWFLSMVHILHRWMVVVSAFTHLLPYIACTAYPVILTAMNKEIRSAHSTIIDSKRRQLSTIREGALQAMIAHTGMIQGWMRLATVQKLSTSTEVTEYHDDKNEPVQL